MWMNEWDVEDAVDRFDEETPNLRSAAEHLERLMRWTNSHSDGWPYWPKPSRAAKSLMEMLTQAKTQYYRGHVVTDVTDAELAKVLRPIKSFLTRQGVEHSEVFSA